MWQYYSDQPALNNNENIISFCADSNNSKSFTKDVKTMFPLKYLSNFGRTREMSIINCEINLQLKWSNKFILVAEAVANKNPAFQITNTKLYVPVVTLSTQGNIKLFKQLESGFKRTINWNKYLAK